MTTTSHINEKYGDIATEAKPQPLYCQVLASTDYYHSSHRKNADT